MDRRRVKMKFKNLSVKWLFGWVTISFGKRRLPVYPDIGNQLWLHAVRPRLQGTGRRPAWQSRPVPCGSRKRNPCRLWTVGWENGTPGRDRLDDFLEATEQANAISQPQAWNGINGLLNLEPRFEGNRITLSTACRPCGKPLISVDFYHPKCVDGYKLFMWYGCLPYWQLFLYVLYCTCSNNTVKTEMVVRIWK